MSMSHSLKSGAETRVRPGGRDSWILEEVRLVLGEEGEG